MYIYNILKYVYPAILVWPRNFHLQAWQFWGSMFWWCRFGEETSKKMVLFPLHMETSGPTETSFSQHPAFSGSGWSVFQSRIMSISNPSNPIIDWTHQNTLFDTILRPTILIDVIGSHDRDVFWQRIHIIVQLLQKLMHFVEVQLPTPVHVTWKINERQESNWKLQNNTQYDRIKYVHVFSSSILSIVSTYVL